MRLRLKPIGTALFLCLALSASGCGGFDVWPFGRAAGPGRSSRLADAVPYLCSGGKSFRVRMLDNGSAAWIIFADREVRFERTGTGPGVRYSNGSSALDIEGNKASLQDGPGVSFADCKAGDR